MIAAGFLQAKQVLRQVLSQPLEPILHPSVWRVRWAGCLLFVGHIFYGFVWQYVLPQTYENIYLRFILAIFGLTIVAARVTQNLNTKKVRLFFSFVLWVQLPLFFNIMFLLNNGSSVWLSSCVAMVLIYYHMTDWRIASIGMISALFFTTIFYIFYIPAESLITPVNALTYIFAWSAALVLGISSVNLRVEHLKNTLSTMGILAHELRTPIASVAMMSDILHDVVDDVRTASDSAATSEKLKFLSSRLETLVRVMTNHIDTQIANARQSMPVHDLKIVTASSCIEHVLKLYPFVTDAERFCVQYHLNEDFHFMGIDSWLIQVLNNFIKNALYALAIVNKSLLPGDLCLTISIQDDQGFISIADRGVGMSAASKKNAFEPFYSTNQASSHGLGLAYCKRVITAFGGVITLQSELGVGTVFTLQLPHII